MTPEEISAAEAALAKQKPASDLIDPNDDVYEFDGHRNEYFGKVHSVCPQMAGVSRKSCGRDIRSTKKPRKDAKVNEPETKSVIKPAAPHESAKVEETKPTTVRGWLETIPDPAIRAAAIRQCRWPDYTVNSPEDALKSGLFWCECSEGGAFWSMCHSAALGERPWPAYPPKAKQEADGWTQAEIDKAAFKDDPISHPAHYTKHPSGVECIQITEHMGFCLGNAVKYIWRADLKNDAIEDLKKSVWYINREIEKRTTKTK